MKSQSDPIGVRRKKSDPGAIRHRIQWFWARSEGRTESPGMQHNFLLERAVQINSISLLMVVRRNVTMLSLCR